MELTSKWLSVKLPDGRKCGRLSHLTPWNHGLKTGPGLSNVCLLISLIFWHVLHVLSVFLSVLAVVVLTMRLIEDDSSRDLSHDPSTPKSHLLFLLLTQADINETNVKFVLTMPTLYPTLRKNTLVSLIEQLWKLSFFSVKPKQGARSPAFKLLHPLTLSLSRPPPPSLTSYGLAGAQSSIRRHQCCEGRTRIRRVDGITNTSRRRTYLREKRTRERPLESRFGCIIPPKWLSLADSRQGPHASYLTTPDDRDFNGRLQSPSNFILLVHNSDKLYGCPERLHQRGPRMIGWAICGRMYHHGVTRAVTCVHAGHHRFLLGTAPIGFQGC